MLSVLMAPLIIVSSCNSGHSSSAIDHEFYEDIDEEISKSHLYENDKERRIESLRFRIGSEESPEVRFELTDLLISEFEAYVSDSALYYINLNLENPSVINNQLKTNSLLIKKADIAAHAGLFGEAEGILEEIDHSSLDSHLLEEYYSAFCDLYQYQSEYATNSEFGREFERQRQRYIDSITKVASPSSMNYIVYHAAEDARNGNFRDAEDVLIENLKKYKSGDRNYSILASILADIYKQKGDKEKYKTYLGLSVISDIRGAVKENMAIRALATECYEDGDLERADRYLRKSFEDANFYAARMRNAQSSRMLPIIGEAYISQQKKMNHELTLFVVFMSVLAAGFIIISIFAFFQVRKVRAVNKKTKHMLEEVSQLSSQLASVNRELKNTNSQLESSNKIRGEYGALFMEYCSLAISSLQHYQQSLKVAAAQGNIQALIKKIDSANVESKTLAEFYSKFDEAILNIYPHFVEKFNSLLRPEERIILRPGENLNTELRVFALIKIGINDPEKIAKFLRCSLTTVYTYRSKMKKRALSPDSFDHDLLSL